MFVQIFFYVYSDFYSSISFSDPMFRIEGRNSYSPLVVYFCVCVRGECLYVLNKHIFLFDTYYMYKISSVDFVCTQMNVPGTQWGSISP